MNDITVRNGFDGRDLAGRFGPNNKLGKGHVTNRRMAELRRMALEAETPQRVARVLGKMRALANKGDVPAAKVYLETVIGKAPQAVELSGPDGERLGQDVKSLVIEISAALGAFPEEVRFAVLGAMKRAVNVDAGRSAE